MSNLYEPVKVIENNEEWLRIKSTTQFLVVDFYADWCGPCRVSAPIFEKMASQYTLCRFVKVNVDKLSDIATAENVSAMPTFKLYKNGAMVSQLVGNVHDLGNMIAKNLL